jgi:lipoprotein-anchoring transpeptidase ErfK/SrfK
LRRWPLALALPLALAAGEPARAAVRVHIDVSTQRMYVTSSSGSYRWPVSTARRGYRTPHGSFSAKSLQRMHYSSKYENAPMPHSIFFSGGYAIHGTYETRALGRPVSHGCVRLSPGHAAALYSMVKREGARISISGRR